MDENRMRQAASELDLSDMSRLGHHMPGRHRAAQQ